LSNEQKASALHRHPGPLRVKALAVNLKENQMPELYFSTEVGTQRIDDPQIIDLTGMQAAQDHTLTLLHEIPLTDSPDVPPACGALSR
jgi:hypothetical protein